MHIGSKIVFASVNYCLSFKVSIHGPVSVVICTKKIYNMYNNLSTSIALYCVEYNILQANLHAGNLRYLQGIHKPKMAKQFCLHAPYGFDKRTNLQHIWVAITSNPITIPRGKILTCTSHIEDDKKKMRLQVQRPKTCRAHLAIVTHRR